jgi:hypothetical protein
LVDQFAVRRKTMTLWRPVGLKGMALIFDSEMKAFPPRLPEQPIFYPVLNPDYAEKIARDWNTKEEDRAGYVTRFEVSDSLACLYERQQVGGSEHQEWWVPVGDLPAFNEAIQGRITVERAFFAPDFRGLISQETGLKGKDAIQQFTAMARHLGFSGFDVWCES